MTVREKKEKRLFKCAFRGDLPNVQKLLESGIDPNIKDGFKRTPIVIATQRNYYKVVEMLIKHGAKTALDRGDGNKIMHIAAEYNAELSANVMLRMEYRHVHCHKEKDFECVTDLGIDVANDNGDLPIHIAINNFAWNTVSFFCVSMQDVDIKNKYGLTPLHQLCSITGYNYLRCKDRILFLADLMLAKGADPNSEQIGEPWNTVMFTVILNKHDDLMYMLCQHNMDVNHQNVNNLTPLHFCAIWGQYVMAKMLIDAGAKINTGDDRQFTPLHYATDGGHLEMCMLLIKNGAKTYLPTENWVTAKKIIDDKPDGFKNKEEITKLLS